VDEEEGGGGRGEVEEHDEVVVGLGVSQSILSCLGGGEHSQ
jgi:hypothetical protein